MSQHVWHNIETKEALTQFNSSPSELTSAKAVKRLAEYGQNIISEKHRRALFRMVLRQLTDFMIVVLLIAALISGFIIAVEIEKLLVRRGIIYKNEKEAFAV